MPAANVSYFENLWRRQKGKIQAGKDILVIAIVFMGMIMYPAGPVID